MLKNPASVGVFLKIQSITLEGHSTGGVPIFIHIIISEV